MTIEIPKNECAKCIYCHNWECRRYPPVLTKPCGYFNDAWHLPEWNFPPSGTPCGEFDAGDNNGGGK